MNQLLRALRSTPFRFMQLDGDDAKYYHELQVRENKRGEADALQHNVVQVCLEIWSFKRGKEDAFNTTLSSESVAKLFESSSEPRSAGHA